MHEGVIRDVEQQRVRRERQLDFEMQKTLEKEYRKVQDVIDDKGEITPSRNGWTHCSSERRIGILDITGSNYSPEIKILTRPVRPQLSPIDKSRNNTKIGDQ
jgi:hypothetical protein